jgi:hypothetical protein
MPELTIRVYRDDKAFPDNPIKAQIVGSSAIGIGTTVQDAIADLFTCPTGYNAALRVESRRQAVRS